MLLLTYIPFFGISQNTISGKVVDELGLPIYMASVEIDQTDDITYTNYEGEFTLTSKKDFHWKVNIKSKGYKSESFFVLGGRSTESLVMEYDDALQSILEKKIGLNKNTFEKSFISWTFLQNLRKKFAAVSRNYPNSSNQFYHTVFN